MLIRKKDSWQDRFGFDLEESEGNVEIEDFLFEDSWQDSDSMKGGIKSSANVTVVQTIKKSKMSSGYQVRTCHIQSPGYASMIVCSPISTCVKNVVHLSGRVQQMGSTILNVVSGGKSASCCFSLYPGRSRSNYSRLSVSKTFSCPSISFHTFRRNCFVSSLTKQRANLQTLTVNGLVNSRGPLKRQLNISLQCQNKIVRLSVSKQRVLSKIEDNVGSISWSQGYTTTGIICGLLVCYSSSEPTHAEAATQKNKKEDNCTLSDVTFSHGKEVYTDYSIIGEHQFIVQSIYRIPGDGRCLFRSVVHGACLRSGKPAPSENLQRELADDLRSEVADEFIKRREETEWFIEGYFDTYVSQMRKPHVWGGEPELLMASHVLKMPITVYMHDKNAGGLISIAEYGQEYGKENPIRVIYYGCGHYDALQLPATRGGKSKL
ncbi:unnamed protein product [Dovyalis caffra]|uniref:Ubiquitin thioesterase OTU n=1 Tax=Dovyalis caffra TaxID=77055 RepID=A0AAV1S1H0_9ROSI|nr:unnamed protein product [Dovyalis caffra]